MKKLKNAAYTRADLRLWRDRMMDAQLRPSERPAGLVPAAIVESLGIQATPTGVNVFWIAGNDIQLVHLNPVVAHALVEGIVSSGRAAGWLDDDGEVVTPPD